MSSSRSLSCLVAALLSSAGSVLAVEESRAQEARAAYAYVTNNLNQRAGPNTRFPALEVIPARTQITVNGCLADLSWCEGAYGDIRGWMSATYLRLYDYNAEGWVEVDDYARSTRLPRYSFDLDRYWTAHYRDRPFYPQRAAWLVAPGSPAIDNGVFYRELSPYGRWTQLEGRYVFMPEVREGWRPYTDGRWEYTQRYGWTWVSNEAFGWATYHYGRWAYSNRLGWVWVPGTQWAPAWVAWRGSEDHLAWAPLPPDAGPGYAIDERYDAIPSYYWQVVPSESFLRPNLAEVILRNDDRDRRGYLDRAQPIGNVTVINNTVVNNVINIKYVEEKTRERVVPREIVITNDESRRQPSQASEEAVVRIYQPPVSEAPATETPEAVLPAEVAAGQSQTAGQAGDEPATEDRVAEAPPAEAAVPPTEAPPMAADEALPVETPAEMPAEGTAQPPADAPPPPAAAEEPAPPADAPPSPPPAVEEPAPPADAPPPPAAEEPAPPADSPPAPPAVEEPAPPADAPPPPPAMEEPSPPADAPPPPPAVEEPAPPADAPPPPPAVEEPVPPVDAPPPPPAMEEPSPPADAPPPPPAVEEPVPPADAPPPPPAMEEPAPPADAPPPPPAMEEPAPPADAPPPPPAMEEPAPPADAPPPPPAAEEPAPPADAPPPPAVEEPAPPADAPPPLPAVEEQAPPADAPPPAVEEPAPPADAPPPPPDAEEAAPPAAEPQAQDCDEGMRLNKKGECVPRKSQ